MTTLRLGLLLAAAAILPSCGHERNDWVHVTVHNDGDHAVDVHAEAEYWSTFRWENHLDQSMTSHETAEFHFNFDGLNRLKVRIYRASDGLKIFDDFWDRNDLEHLDEHVTITVNP